MTEIQEVSEQIGQQATRYVFGPCGDSLLAREKITLLALAEVADEQGRLQVPASELCRMIGITQPTLRKSIGSLSDMGLVENLGLIGPAMRRVIHRGSLRDGK